MHSRGVPMREMSYACTRLWCQIEKSDRPFQILKFQISFLFNGSVNIFILLFLLENLVYERENVLYYVKTRGIDINDPINTYKSDWFCYWRIEWQKVSIDQSIKKTNYGSKKERNNRSMKMIQSLIPMKTVIFAGSRILIYSFQSVIRKMEPS